MCCSVLQSESIMSHIMNLYDEKERQVHRKKWIPSVLQCVVVRRSMLQCVAVCCSVLQCVAVCCCVLQCVAVCCNVLQCNVECCSVM